jgi:hypothetical protein
MLDTFITENEVFTLATSFPKLIEKVKKWAYRDGEAAKLAEEYAVIDQDSDVVAISATIKELEKRLDAAASRAKTGIS